MAEGDAPRTIAEFFDYEGLLGACRTRVNELAIAGEVFDEFAGLPRGYLSKLTGQHPVRRIGMTSMGPLFSAMGVKLVMVEDPSSTARLRALPPRNASFVRTMPAAASIVFTWRQLKRIRRLGGQARMAMLTPKQRSELGRKAAFARWRGFDKIGTGIGTGRDGTGR